MPQDSLHLDEVDQTLEVLLGADGHLDHDGVGSEDVAHLLHGLEEVGTRAVHLVHVADTRHVILVSLTPDRLGLGLHAVGSRIGGDGAVEHTERTLHLSGEVDVSRSVNEIDLVLVLVPLPVAGGCSRGDGDTTLLLLSHPVHGGCTIVHLADLVGLTRVEEDTLRSSCLTSVDVSHDADVAGQMQILFCHLSFKTFSLP